MARMRGWSLHHVTSVWLACFGTVCDRSAFWSILTASVAQGQQQRKFCGRRPRNLGQLARIHLPSIQEKISLLFRGIISYAANADCILTLLHSADFTISDNRNLRGVVSILVLSASL